MILSVERSEAILKVTASFSYGSSLAKFDFLGEFAGDSIRSGLSVVAL